MKRALKPATFLAVVAAIFSINHFRTPSSVAARSVHSASAPDPYDSEAAYRHRTCQPRHWRGMMLRQ